MPDRGRTALIVGSGFPAPDGLDTEAPRNRFGSASAPLFTRTLGDREVTVLMRHGLAHSLPPHVINYRANLQALHDSGATSIVAVNTVGLIATAKIKTRLAVPDQILDYTWGRAHTLYSDPQPGFAHIEFTEPLAAGLRAALLAAARSAAVDCFDGGVYAATQGPRLETAAEVNRYERDGADLVGMTGMPEAALAAELDLPYAMLSLIVNPAAGRDDRPIHDAVAAATEAARSDCLTLLDAFFGASDDG